MQDYNELAAFMRANKSNPLMLAKVMVSWIWASVQAYDGPTKVTEVVSMLKGSCGWRDLLMESLFREIGIEHRRVNFNDVPFQVGHSATELKINGKWMFFDATSGVYFSFKGSKTPISIEEARNNWPDVVVNRSSLEGWQGTFLDPKTISANKFHIQDHPFLIAPTNFYDEGGYVPAELFTIYFGPKAQYRDNGRETPIPNTARSWKAVKDTDGTKNWSKILNFYDADGSSEAQYTFFDNQSHKFIHWDRSDKYAWAKRSTYISAGSRIEYEVIINDDRTKIYHANNIPNSQDWTDYYVFYSSRGATDYELVLNRDGTSVLTEMDESYSYAWTKFQDVYDSAGTTLRTTITYDDGTSVSFDWSKASRVAGNAENNALAGTADNDAIFGLQGDDTLDGGSGADRLEGGAGNDVYYADTLQDIVIERANNGSDSVFSSDNHILGRYVENLFLTGEATYGTGNEFNNSVIGNDRKNTLTGNAGSDLLRGMSGEDLLTGGAGHDTLEGGLGVDALFGGSGADVFFWRSLDEIGSSKRYADVVRDFSRANGDVLSLAMIDANENRTGNQGFAFIGTDHFSAPGQIRYARSGSETLLFFNTDGDTAAEAVLRLSGKLKPDASWFVL